MKVLYIGTSVWRGSTKLVKPGDIVDVFENGLFYTVYGFPAAKYLFKPLNIIKLECVNAEDSTRYAPEAVLVLTHGSVYEGFMSDAGSAYNIIFPSLRYYSYSLSRFVIVENESARPTLRQIPIDKNFDAEENRLRMILTTPSDPYSCRKCGAPTSPKNPCAYHPLASSCK